MKLLLITLLFSTSAFTQVRLGTEGGGGQARALTGIEGGGGQRTVLRVESTIVRPLTMEELRRGVDTGLGYETRGSLTSTTSKFALDFSNVEEITLTDGTVLKVEEIVEKASELRKLPSVN